MSGATPSSQFASPCPPVLLVDDDADVRESLRMIFETEGYSAVAEAATMADAFAYLATTALPHVVLLDFLMPHANADMLLRLIDRDATLQRHRYILMPASPITRFSDKSQRLINTHCMAIVYKPFDLTTLLDAVKQAEAQLPAPPPSIP